MSASDNEQDRTPKQRRRPASRARDAMTGRYVTKEYAEAHPDVTVVERVDPKTEAAETD